MVDTRTCAERVAERIVLDYIEPKNYMMMAFSLPKDALPFGWYTRNWIYIGSAWLQDELRLSRYDYGALQRALIFDRAKLTPHIEAAKERRWREDHPVRYPSWL